MGRLARSSTLLLRGVIITGTVERSTTPGQSVGGPEILHQAETQRQDEHEQEKLQADPTKVPFLELGGAVVGREQRPR